MNYRKDKIRFDSAKQKSSIPSPISTTTIGNGEPFVKEQKYELKVMNLSKSPKNPEKFCECCGREFQEVEIHNTKLILEQEKLNSDIKKAKEELAQAMSELKIEQSKKPMKNEEDESCKTIFNIENLDNIQELLEDAEENDQLLLFVDTKGNTWQITRGKDILYDIKEEKSERPV